MRITRYNVAICGIYRSFNIAFFYCNRFILIDMLDSLTSKRRSYEKGERRMTPLYDPDDANVSIIMALPTKLVRIMPPAATAISVI